MEVLMLTTCILMISALVVLHYLSKKTKEKKEKPIPGPPFFEGLTTFLKGSHDGNLHIYLSEWAKKYGEIVRINLVAKNVVIVNNSSTFQHLVKSAEFREFTNDRPPTNTGKHFVFGEKDIGFVSSGPELKFRRRLFHNVLKFYGEGIGQFEQLMMITLTELVGELSSRDRVNLPQFLKNYILNLMAFLISGDVSESGRRKVASIKAYSDWITLVSQFSYDTLLQIFPFLRFIPGLHYKRYHQETLKSIQNLHENYFEDMRKTFDPNHKRGLLDEMFCAQQELEKEGNFSGLDNDCIKAIVQDVVAAGFLTTSSSLALLFLQLVMNQEIQDKIYAEIKSVIGDSIPSFQHKTKMPYTEAVILETTRFASSVPLLVPHFSNQDIVFEGYNIPKSTILTMNAYYNHHREDYWEEPSVFKPERFLASDGQLVDVSHPARQRLIPFGTGARSCPGEMFAKSRMFLITTFLVKEFHFSPDENAPLPSSHPKDWSGGIVVSPDEYICLVKSRVYPENKQNK